MELTIKLDTKEKQALYLSLFSHTDDVLQFLKSIYAKLPHKFREHLDLAQEGKTLGHLDSISSYEQWEKVFDEFMEIKR